jgi:hypothetical protein
MSTSLVDRIVEAVLYEGYILYPYRSSSIKNRKRFTFGRVYPRAYRLAGNESELSAFSTQCVALGDPEESHLEVRVRFLHPTSRTVGLLPEPLATLPDGAKPALRMVPEVRIGGSIHQSWEEAVEREIVMEDLVLSDLLAGPRTLDFAFDALSEDEPLRDDDGAIVALLLRRGERLEGKVSVSAGLIDPAATRIMVEIENLTPLPGSAPSDQERVLLSTLASTHTVLRLRGAGFISMTDPPPAYAEAVAACGNVGTWPVLVGEEGAFDTMLSSPIILYDYPQIAPESRGDLFDGTEIDEILTLRIMTMTDREKWEMRDIDRHARNLLERTESLDGDDLLGMHGTIRGLRPVTDDEAPPVMFDPLTGEPGDPFGASHPLDGVMIDGHFTRAGDHVLIRPKARADIFDMLLAGKRAVVEAVEQDMENRIHLALVLEDDPGRDLGMMRQPGHRFFFAPEEVQPVREEP